jgi:hypothetical protein
MSDLVSYMEEGKLLIFSLPNLQKMLEKKYTNCINFEHTVFLTEPYIEYLLIKHGFRLIDKEYFLEDHSIFYSAVRDASLSPINLQPNLYAQNRLIYDEYVRYHESLIKNLNQQVNDTVGPLYLFGAHIFSQYLIANGLATDRIDYILDNDPKKQGKRLYGTNLVVQSPKILGDIEIPTVILKAGIYNDEIKEDIFNNINAKVRFLE